MESLINDGDNKVVEESVKKRSENRNPLGAFLRR